MGKPARPVLAPRPAPALTREAEAFIAGGTPPASARPPEPPAVAPPPLASDPSAPSSPTPASSDPTPSSSAGRSVVQRKDGRELRRKTIYLPPELAERLDVYSARKRIDQSVITAEALAMWLDSKGA